MRGRKREAQALKPKGMRLDHAPSYWLENPKPIRERRRSRARCDLSSARPMLISAIVRD